LASCRRFQPALRVAGLPEGLGFHDLRHTCASLLIAQGAHPKAIQLHLGHSSIQITMDCYGHLFPDELGHLADRLDAAHAAATDPARTSEGETVASMPAKMVRRRR
jgi:integrase